jgi:hypothetical protein
MLTAFLVIGVKTVFGWELMFGAVGCKINTNSVPDGTDATVVTLQPNVGDPYLWQTRNMRHGIYDHVRCLGIICGWVEAKWLLRTEPRVQ